MRFIFITILFLSYLTSFSQPANDDCSGAISLTPSFNCSYTTGTVENATQSLPANCGGTANNDVWYSFVATYPVHHITVDGDTYFDAVFEVYDACGGTSLDCIDVGGNNTAEETTLTGLTVGNTYYVRVYDYGNDNPSTPTFDICIMEPPPNDDCSGAISLTPNNTCSYTTGSVENATQSQVGCTGTANNDVWYSFTATHVSHFITIDGSSSFDAVFEVFDGCGGSSLICEDLTSNGEIERNSISGLTIGNTYYIRVYDFGNDIPSTQTFNICITNPAINDECADAITLTPNDNCSYTSGTVEDATQSLPANCGSATANNDVWYTFTATNVSHFITVDGSQYFDAVVEILDACNGNTIKCIDANGNDEIERDSVCGLTIGNDYYIRVYDYENNTPSTTTFDICITNPVENDECVNAITLTPNDNCSYTSGTVEDATQSLTACTGTANNDVWYTFTATRVTHFINVEGSSYFDPVIQVFNGNCGGNSLACVDNNGNGDIEIATVQGLTIGNNYYIRIYDLENNTPSTTTFDICITNPVENDECANAISLTVNPDYNCNTMTSGTIENSTASSNSSSCSGTHNDDVWFSFVATETGHRVSLHNIVGSTTDMYHSIYSGNCGSLTEISCNDDNSTDISGLTVGNTYYVRVYSYGSTDGQNTTFDICVGTIPPQDACGNPLPSTNDYCSNPATLTYDGGTWSSNTSSQYTDGTPGNLGSIFCGSIENNSWYQFTASSTTETFDFTSVTNCQNSDGIQAEVYEVTSDANGCCVDFTSVSNCWNPGTQTTGTVTASGLTVGNNYILMIDGYAGDDCDFTVDGWSADGILPVVISYFDGIPKDYYNQITWITLSEINNNNFILEKSEDAINFYEIKNISGNGNSNKINKYSVIDDDVTDKIQYYRLKQIDFNGKINYSKTISISNNLKTNNFKLSSENGQINIVFDELIKESYSIMVVDCSGKVIAKKVISPTEGKAFTITNNKLYDGVYNVIVYNKNHSNSKKILMLNK